MSMSQGLFVTMDIPVGNIIFETWENGSRRLFVLALGQRHKTAHTLARFIIQFLGQGLKLWYNKL